MKEVWLQFDWIPVLSSDGMPYLFPEAISSYFQAKSSVPAVYRWAVLNSGVMKQVYYGEAENLARRIDGYRRVHPGQRTNAHLKTLFVNLLTSGNTISLDKLAFEPFLLNGLLIDEKALGRKEIRCLLESALMVMVPNGVELLNKVTSLEAKATKKVRDVFDRLTPAERQYVVQTMLPRKSESKG